MPGGYKGGSSPQVGRPARRASFNPGRQPPSASSIERLPPGISDSHADNLDRPPASMHDL